MDRETASERRNEREREREKEKKKFRCGVVQRSERVMKAIFFISCLTPEDSGEEIRAK